MFRISVLFFLFILVAPASVAAAFDVPEQFQRGVTIVHSDNMPPMAFIGLDGNPKGFVIDFWRRWSAETGVPVSFRLMKWEEGLKFVKAVDTAIHGGLYKTGSRSKYLDYSERLFPVKIDFFALKESGISAISDLSGRIVGVLEQGASQEFMQVHHPYVRLRSYPSIKDMVSAIIDRKVDAVLANYPSFMYIAGSMGLAKGIVTVESVPEDAVYAAVGRGRIELLDLVRRGVELVDDAGRADILQSWFVAESESSHALLVGVLVSLFGLFVLLCLLYLRSWVRGRPRKALTTRESW